MIKSVSLISETRDTYVLAVVLNLKDSPELAKMPAADKQLIPVGLLMGDFKYKATVDKRKNTVSKVSIDLARYAHDDWNRGHPVPETA